MVHMRFKMYFFLFVFDRKYEQTIREYNKQIEVIFHDIFVFGIISLKICMISMR